MIQKALILVLLVCLALVGWQLIQIGVLPNPATLVASTPTAQRYVADGLVLTLGLGTFGLWLRYA